ncbi:MAG: hypothetical protein ACMUIG_07080 [Thermoplasmatota archaeon]
MARKKYSGGKKQGAMNRKPNPGERLRKPMLNIRRLDYFKFDLNELVDSSDIEENLIPSFKATIIAKASQRSISEAKDYINDMAEREQISDDIAGKLCRLLERYTKYR